MELSLFMVKTSPQGGWWRRGGAQRKELAFTPRAHRPACLALRGMAWRGVAGRGGAWRGVAWRSVAGGAVERGRGRGGAWLGARRSVAERGRGARRSVAGDAAERGWGRGGAWGSVAECGWVRPSVGMAGPGQAFTAEPAACPWTCVLPPGQVWVQSSRYSSSFICSSVVTSLPWARCRLRRRFDKRPGGGGMTVGGNNEVNTWRLQRGHDGGCVGRRLSRGAELEGHPGQVVASSEQFPPALPAGGPQRWGQVHGTG